MSDDEDDREFLADIEALQHVLANVEPASGENSEKPTCNLVGRRANVSSRGFGEVEAANEKEIEKEEDSHDPETAYALNKKLIKILMETKRELTKLLDRCLENRTKLDEKIRMKANCRARIIPVSLAGMPYFKDKNRYSAPWNNDMKKKKLNGELNIVHLQPPHPWTERDRKLLWKAIRDEASSKVLHKTNGRPAREDSNKRDENAAVSLALPKNFKTMVGPLGARDFDWLKVALNCFNGKHTDMECKVMWNMFLHPDINKRKWTKEEDAQMERLNAKYNHQNWEAIARELNTQRSSYQCFVRFNTTHFPDIYSEGNWSVEEEERLKIYVDRLRIGNYIPWGIVSRYMDGRTKNQTYYHWMFHMSCDSFAHQLKKGRFTKEEDERLIAAVQKYGENFRKIAHCVMVDRTSSQLADHYKTLAFRMKGHGNVWTIEADARLVRLYSKYGSDWVRIASEFPGKNRTQIRHRHKTIVKYWDKNISLVDIPRDQKKRHRSIYKVINDQIDSETIDQIRELEQDKVKQPDGHDSEMAKIDRELLKYFEFVPSSSRPGRKKKYYSNEELRTMTSELYFILKVLDTRLQLPDDLEETSLTEKDKQLIKSLKDFTKMQNDRTNIIQKDLQYFDEFDNGKERHFYRVCSGNCNRQKRVFHDKIEYEAPNGIGHSQLTLSKDIETPKSIIDCFTDEENENFERMSKIALTRINEPGERNIMEQKNMRDNYFNKTSSLRSTDIEEIWGNDKTKEPRKRSKNEKWVSLTISNTGLIKESNETYAFIEPNYHTMLGWLHIMKNKKDYESEQDRQVQEISLEATRAMVLLRRRLLQLFKYPIVLSCIEPKKKETPANTEDKDPEASCSAPRVKKPRR